MKHLRTHIGRVHFVGIGGIGMSGIAEILVRLGFTVTGSDLNTSGVTRHLETLGVTVWQGHDPAHVGEAHAVVYSSAVTPDNPELARARELGVPVIRRAEMLAELMRMKTGVAIGGTHGKTTTTSLVGTVLTRAGLDPTVIVGGLVRDMDTNARLGSGDLLVCEADEYDRSFLRLTPVIAVITTLEAEHLDTYGTVENLREAFASFANSVPFYGRAIISADDPELVALRGSIERPVVSYGFSERADVRGVDAESAGASSCRVLADGDELGTIEIPLAGRHNLANALAAVAVARELEIPFAKVRDALAGFSGVRRRFDLRGEIAGVTVIDDYAHHPTEVAVTLAAARDAYPGRPIVALFQPHLFSRTKRFSGEFASALALADRAFITDVYPAREQPLEGVSGELVAQSLRERNEAGVYYLPRFQDIAPAVYRTLSGGEVVITLGAGNIYIASAELLGLLADGEDRGRA
ncbi:MAG: UDP-N-acetylmuramate--L-alanine ligase [Calditrichaeota bacterium]|nr:UDP-N-acetylmuramate--L-alanine ligase [Calditrichota bacterium]